MSIIRTNIPYTHAVFAADFAALLAAYPCTEHGSIGKSVMGRDLPYIRLGTGKRKVFYSASYHANEWITTPVLMKFAEEVLASQALDRGMHGHSIKELLFECSIYIVPMVNPDGVDIVTGGLTADREEYIQAKAIADAYPHIPFPDGWKANIQGVDLNLQFPAGWEQARANKAEIGITAPAPRDFVGDRMLSAPESVAVYNFAKQHDFSLVMAYHTQGKVIYWQYLDRLPRHSREIGQCLSKLSGYDMEEVPFASGFAGFKDWFIEEYDRPGYTIEAGWGESPLPLSQFDEIYADNVAMLVKAAVMSGLVQVTPPQTRP